MNERLVNTRLPGLLGSDKREYLNPNNSSFCVSYLDKGQIMLIRSGEKAVNLKPWQDELQKRKESIGLHKKLLPKYTYPQGQVVLQGYHNGTRVPFLGRMMERFDNVVSTDNLSLTAILSDSELCTAYKDYSLSALKLLIHKHTKLDAGIGWRMDNKLNLSGLFKFNNIMLGSRAGGEKVVFVDPDASTEMPLNIKGIGSTVIRSAHFTASFLLYGSADIYHKVVNKLNGEEPAEIFRKRFKQKETTIQN